MESGPPISPRWAVRLLVAAALLAVAHIGPRAYIFSISGFENRPRLDEPVKYLPKLILGSVYDITYVTGLTLAFLVILTALPRAREPSGSAAGSVSNRSNRWGRIVYSLFLAAALLSFAAALVNAVVVRQLGRPFNYQWLYYSDFLRGTDARLAMKESLSWGLVASALCACAVFVMLALTLGKRAERLSFNRAYIAACGVAILTYLLAANWYVTDRAFHHDRTANAVYAFTKSVIIANRAPSLFTMKATVDDSDFRPPTSQASPFKGGPARIRHVILFVFESVPAEYVGVYGSKYNVTPNLDRWSAHAAIFDNAYAHAPATNKSLFSMLCGAYPWISFKAETQEFPDIALPSISSTLKSRGYATGFFFGGDLSFQGAGDFLSHRNFDLLQDYKSRKSTRKIFTNDQWPFLNGSDELSTVESLISWLDEQHHANRPAFAMLWTMMTHYPYFTDGPPDDLGPTENLFNIYLNALRTGDRAFGALLEHLEREKLLDETLVIVTGDHGEAFGRHWQLAHGNRIYEENVHVPLMLINPKLFKGEHHKTIAGHIDVAPTIADILQFDAPTEWQGRSLFAPGRPDRTYFFAPWSDYHFGLRDGDTKFIYNASTNRYEMYDLSRDPREEINLIDVREKEIPGFTQRLAAWVQYQDASFRKRQGDKVTR